MIDVENEDIPLVLLQAVARLKMSGMSDRDIVAWLKEMITVLNMGLQ